MGILVSPLVDKGLFQWVFSGGSVLMVASMVLLSFCKTYWQLFLVQGLVMGVAMGLIFSSGIIVLISYFSKNLGVATGIAASGGSMGLLNIRFLSVCYGFVADWSRWNHLSPDRPADDFEKWLSLDCAK